ncbi:SatD family protein [Orenia marismortui]|uniref:SatD family protein n=1 Tax=Orenia marismortui TaxID=46469 RepID=UPI0003729C90|nr:SatD family protein [Orenia marismortui]
MNYCAIISDVVDSRKLKNRAKAQNKIKTAIKDINQKYKEELAAKFMIYAGDEVQGLLKIPSLSYEIITQLQARLRPIKLAVGVGIGGIATSIPSNPVTWELDGEAYHRARSMLNKAKEKRPSICYSFSSNSSYSSYNEVESDLINSLLYFIESNREYRTKRQKEIVQLYKEYKNQERVADKLGVSQVSISKVLNKALYYEVNKAENSIINYLKNFDSRNI